MRTFTPTLLGGLLLAFTSLVPALAQTSNYGIEVPSGQHHIAAGTTLKVKLLQDVTSASAQSGDRVRVQVEDDSSGLPAGTIFNGRVSSVTRATPKSAGVLHLRFGGSGYTSTASADLTGQKPVADKTSQYGEAGAGAGALIGLLRKGKLGDAIGGAVVGGAAGLGANQLLKKSASDVSLKRGQDITITLTRPLTLRTQVVTPY